MYRSFGPYMSGALRKLLELKSLLDLGLRNARQALVQLRSPITLLVSTGGGSAALYSPLRFGERPCPETGSKMCMIRPCLPFHRMTDEHIWV